MSIERWTAKEDVVHLYNGILLSQKNKQNNAFHSNMDATRNYHTKWSKKDEAKYHMVSLTCGI